MAAASNVVTLTADLNKLWRKSQGSFLMGVQTKCEEYDLLDELTDDPTMISPREITRPVDVRRAGGLALIPEGGYEGRPGTPSLAEITYSWSNYSKRFAVSLTTKYLDKFNPDAQIKKQLRYHVMKLIEAVSNGFGRDFYGYSSGVIAKVSGTPSGTTGVVITLKDAYGDANLDDAAFLAQLFTEEDYIAGVRSSALVANSIGGRITAVDASAGTITVDFGGSVTFQDGDSIVFANNLEATTLTGGTSWQKSLVGLKDAMESTSLHGLSGATEKGWNVAYSDTAAGRMNGIKLRKARQQMENKGGEKPDLIIIDQGVDNDMVDAYQAASRYDSTMGMEMDGSVKFKGTKFFSSRKVPPGHVLPIAKRTVNKFNLLPKPGEGMPWEDGYKMQDQNALIFGADFPVGLVYTKRAGLSYFQNQTRQ